MSRQAILQMMSAATQDEALSQKLQAAVSPENLIEVAGECGYEFTAEDLVALIQEQVAEQKARETTFNELTEELSDEDAEMVAGGGPIKSSQLVRRASVNSYFHTGGVIFEDGSTFIGRSSIARSIYVWLIDTFESARYNSNLGEYEVYDEDGDSGAVGFKRVSQLGIGNWQNLFNLTES